MRAIDALPAPSVPSPSLPSSRPTVIQQKFCESVERLEKSIRQESSEFGELQHLAELLDALPLTTEEYGVARNRLRNASRYLRSGERGAAQYELGLLFGSLRPSAQFVRAQGQRHSTTG
jgi:hypothetical protein